MAAGGSRHIEVILPGPLLVGVASETDTARPLTFTKTIVKTLGIVSQANAAQTLPHVKTKTLGVASTANAAQTLTVTKPIRKTLGVTTQANAAQTLPHFKTKTLGVATVAISARPVSTKKSISPASVQMQARPLTVFDPITVTLTRATTVNTARPTSHFVNNYTRVLILSK